MTESDRDFWTLLAVLGLLALSGLMQAKIVRRHDEQIVKLSGDVSWLMDRPPVPHETET